MTKRWIAIALLGTNGCQTGNTSGFVATQSEAELWAEKALNNTNIHGVAIAKLHSKAQRVTSPVEFVQFAEESKPGIFDTDPIKTTELEDLCFGSGNQSARV
jgi:hypothetical protein